MGTAGWRRTGQTLGLLGVGAVSGGCSGFFHTTAGVVLPMRGTDGHIGAAGEGALGLNLSRARGVGLSLRGKFTPAFVQLAGGVEAFLRPIEDLLVLRGGVHVLQAELFDTTFAFGMFSPYLMVTWLPFGERTRRFPISFSAGVEYDVRFTAQRNEPYALFSIGYRVSR